MEYSPNEMILEDDEIDNLQRFMMNVMWLIHNKEYRFDYLLAITAFFQWLKLFFCFRVSQSFGPMFKILYQMTLDLVKFICIWCIVLVMFSCIGILAFG